MRRTFIALGVFVALCLAYVVWPFASLFDVVRAAQTGDTATIAQRVDVPALRRSFTAQLIDTYARLTGKNLDRKGVIGAVAGSFTDPMVEKLLASPIVAELIRTGWTKSILAAERPASLEGLDPGALGNAWQLYLNSDYGVGEVRYAVPASRPKDKQFRVRLSLSQWNWKLAGLDLPHELQEQIVRELIKQERASEKLVGLRRGD
jgi:hypothetical protein